MFFLCSLMFGGRFITGQQFSVYLLFAYEHLSKMWGSAGPNIMVSVLEGVDCCPRCAFYVTFGSERVSLHMAGAPEILTDQSGFSMQEKLYCPY